MKINYLFFCILFFPLFCFSQTENWPFRDSSGLILKGKITGTCSDFRSSGINARFHGGVDMINPNLSGTLARAVFSMHDGTVVVNNTSSFWSSYIAIVLNNGKTVYYKHIRPSTTNPVNNTTVNLIVTNQTISKGDFLGLMILPQSNSNEFLHLHINDNDVSGTLQGNTNWLNQFLFPFEDNKKPNIKYISNNSIISNDIDINAIEFRGNGCAYNINPQPEIRNLSYSDLNGNSRRIIFDKLDLIIRTTDPHIQADGSGSTGNNGIDRIKYQLINSSTQIALEDQNINFSDVPNNSIANQIFDYRSSQSAHTYIISNNNINVPYDRFLNTRLTIDGNETYDLLNRNGLDAISNNHTKFSEGYYEVKVIVSDRNDFTNSDPNESIVSVPILIDNFLPYIKKVTLNDSEGVFYEAEWTLNGSETALEFEQCTYRTNITTGFNVQIETSETLDNLSMSLAGVTNNLVSTNTEKTVWELQNPFNGNASANQTITFTGSDTAGNPLLTDPTNLYWRTGDNIWQNGTTSQPITGNSSITGTDIIHKINMSINCSNSCADNYEPNNTQSQATQLYQFGHSNSENDTFNECIDQATADIDWYRMNLTHQGKLTITLSSQQISSLFIDWLDNGNVTSSTTVSGDKQIVICSNNGPACYDTALRIYTVTQNGNDPIPYTLDIQWSANQSCNGGTSGRQSITNNTSQNNSTITINGNTNVCEGLSNTLSITGASRQFDWFINGQSAHVGNTFNTQSLNTGQYDLFVIDTNNVCSFAETQLNISSSLTANAGQDATIPSGDSTQLQGSGGSSYLWSPTTGLSNPNVWNPIATLTQTTTYTLTVTENGCTDTDTVIVTVSNGNGNPPPNDDCSSAITLTSSTSCNYIDGTVKNATPSVGANNCLGSDTTSPDDYDVYYKFTAVETSHTVTVSNYANNFDAVIELRTACSSGSNNYISCYDPSGAPTSVSETWGNLTIGQTYYIRVFEWNYQGTPPNADVFDICVTHQNSNTDGIDLVSNITSVSDDNPEAGDQITVHYTVTNNGDETTQFWLAPSIYLSSNTILSSSDDYLASGSINQTLSPNETVNLSTNITIPNVSDGQYYIALSPDPADIIDESNEGNNFSFYPIYVGEVSQNGPDLNPSGMSVTPNSGLSPGQEIVVELEIDNDGNEDADNFDVLYFLDIDGDGEYDANEFMREASFGSIDADDDRTRTRTMYLPTSIPSVGSYYVYAIADRNNEIIETNEDNNDKRRSINISTINPAGPDLVCNFVKWEINGTNTEVSSQNLCLDEEYRLYWNITNIGNLDVSGGFQVSHRALISTKPYMDGTAITFDSRFVNASSHDVGTIITADDNSEWEGVSEGNFYLLLVADTGVDVDEINEENNVMVIPITLNNCNNTPLPDVAVNINSVTPFASALGDYITVDMTITNIGNETITQNFGLRLALSEDDEFNGTGGTNNFNDHGLVDDGYDNITQDLSPGQSISHSMTAYTQSGTGTQNPITQAGQMYLFAVLDENGDIVAEQNRDNNIDYVPIELTSVDCYYNFEATTNYTGVYTWNQDSYSLIIRAITEDGCNWTVSSPQDWVFFSTTNFTDSDYIDFTLYENPYPFSRSGQILIENEIFYEFTQDAKPCELLSDDIKISLGSSSITNIDCTTKGSIDISVQNGFPPYTYVWSNGESTQDLDNISQLGDYTVTITDSSGCSLLETFTIIDVENIDTTISLQEITLLVVEDDADSYQWIRCDTSNTVIQGANSQSYEVQDEGSYKVEIVKGDCTVESICFDAFWDFDIDYAITSVGLSCINSDDGTITISTQIENTYNISITSSENNFSENRLMDSSNNWHIIQENLSGGEYIIDITINGYPEGIYKKTFILNLDEPEPLEATNRVASDGNGFTVEMTTGTAPFTIKLNNEIIGTTNASEYSFDANHGDIVEVSTVKACEGKYIETLSMLDAIVLHPNPTDDMVYFSIPTMEDNTALDIQLFDSNGRLIETFNRSISNRQIEISIQHLSIGVYFAKFPTLGETTFKIIKE